MTTTGAAGWSQYGRLRLFLRPHGGRLLWILAISLAATALGLAQPLFSKLLIDTALLAWPALIST